MLLLDNLRITIIIYFYVQNNMQHWTHANLYKRKVFWKASWYSSLSFLHLRTAQTLSLLSLKSLSLFVIDSWWNLIPFGWMDMMFLSKLQFCIISTLFLGNILFVSNCTCSFSNPLCFTRHYGNKCETRAQLSRCARAAKDEQRNWDEQRCDEHSQYQDDSNIIIAAWLSF